MNKVVQLHQILLSALVLGCGGHSQETRDMTSFLEGMKLIAAGRLAEKGKLARSDIDECAVEYCNNANIVDGVILRSWAQQVDVWGNPIKIETIDPSLGISDPLWISSAGSDGAFTTADDISVKISTELPH